MEIHPSYLDVSSHDASLSILVFYTWIGVVIIMMIGAFIALKHRHRVTAVCIHDQVLKLMMLNDNYEYKVNCIKIGT